MPTISMIPAVPLLLVMLSIGPLKVSTADDGPTELTTSVSACVIRAGSNRARRSRPARSARGRSRARRSRSAPRPDPVSSSSLNSANVRLSVCPSEPLRACADLQGRGRNASPGCPVQTARSCAALLDNAHFRSPWGCRTTRSPRVAQRHSGDSVLGHIAQRSRAICPGWRDNLAQSQATGLAGRARGRPRRVRLRVPQR